MKPTDMDADLTTITEPEQLSRRLGYWETRWKLTGNRTAADEQEYDAVRFRHSVRCAKVLGAG